MHKHALSSVRSHSFSTLLARQTTSVLRNAPRPDNDAKSHNAAPTSTLDSYKLLDAIAPLQTNAANLSQGASRQLPSTSANIPSCSAQGSPALKALDHPPHPAHYPENPEILVATAQSLANRHARFLLDSGAGLSDPGRSLSAHYVRNLPEDAVTVAAALSDVVPTSYHIPSPKTAGQLYGTLIFLLRRYRQAPPPPHSLVRYYLNMDSPLHSTKAYNLLLELCIRHQMQGTVQTLIRAMTKNGLRKNTETVKLIVRSHVLAGRWEVAWAHLPWYLHGVPSGQRTYPATCSDANISPPLSVWTEFLSHANRGPPRRIRGLSSRESSGKKRRGRTHTKCDQAQYLQRCAILWRNLPSRPATSTPYLSPRVTYLVVQMLLRMGDKDRAVTFTTEFLERMKSPSAYSINTTRPTPLDVVHLHLVYSPASLPHMVSMVKQFIAVHPDLRPNSTTMLLLLRPLKRLRRSGTVAQVWVNTLKEEWGQQVEDRRVMRRVASLAVKEGNRGLVSMIIEANDSASRRRFRWAHEQSVAGQNRDPPPRWIARLKPWRKGWENWLWKRLKEKVMAVMNRVKKSE